MDILLVLPRTFINLKEPTHFPIGMAYVSAALKQKGYNVDILDLNFEDGSVEELVIKKLACKKFDIVETGGLITHYDLIEEILNCVKKYDPAIYTLVGGGIITGDPEVVMSGLVNADFGVIGEGEITNAEVSEAIIGNIEFENVDGIIWRKRVVDSSAKPDDIIRNKPREEIKDLDSLPWPDYEGFNLDKLMECQPKRYITMSTGRACACHCTFCFHTSGQTYRQRSLDSFFEELDYLVEKYQIDNLYITDELFACNKTRLEELCRRIKSYHILWAVQLRVNIVTKEMLQLLKDSGCIIISFGLESADNRVLKSMRKGITVEMIERALSWSYEVGIEAHGSFIFGDIREDQETVQNTLDWWKKHREYNVNLAMIQVYPGTYLYDYACNNGIIKDKLQFIKDGCPYINVSQLSDKEYLDLGRMVARESWEAFPKLYDNINIEEHKENYRINIETVCPKCREQLRLERVSTAQISVVKCKQCNTKYMLDPYKIYIDNVRKNFENIKKADNKIAFWGANTIFKCLYEDLSNDLELYNVYLVDTNNLLQGMEFNNHIIQSTDVIRKENISTVFICDYVYETYIKNLIKSKYSDVKQIISVGDLIGVK